MDENEPPMENCSSGSSSPRRPRMSMVEVYSESGFDLLALKNELKIKNEIGGGMLTSTLLIGHVRSSYCNLLPL